MATPSGAVAEIIKATPNPRIVQALSTPVPTVTATVRPTPKPTPMKTPTPITSSGSIQDKVAAKTINKFGETQVQAMLNIINHESGFRVDAINASSGACGIGQALPCSKMGCPLNDDGADCQVEWVVSYVASRYGTPANAWSFWQANRWY